MTADPLEKDYEIRTRPRRHLSRGAHVVRHRPGVGSVGGGRGGGIVLNWTGTVKGDEIAFTRAAEGGQGQSQQFTAKRQK